MVAGSPQERMFRVRADNLARLHEEIARLARRGERLGTGSLRLWEVGEREFAPGRDGQRVEYAQVALAGETPQLAGWQIAAVLEHGDRGTTVHLVPGMESAVDTERWQGAGGECEHCGLKRLRKETFVVRHESGSVAQVGSSCLKDFTGANDPERALRQAAYLTLAAEALEEVSEPAVAVPAPERAERVEVIDYLRHVSAVERRDGFVPRSKATDERRSTADLAAANLEATQAGEEAIAIDDVDHERAQAVCVWAREELGGEDELSDYEEHLIDALARRRVLPWERGIVASGLLAYERANGRRGEGHVGEPGATVELDLRVEQVMAGRTTRYGPTFVHTLRDAQGHRFTWFATRTQLIVGERYRVKGKVKRHGDFAGEDVTVLSGCRAEVL